MSDQTAIEWTDATWNPTVGCTKVSPGCDHCYAETLVNRFAGSNKGFPNRFDEMFLRGDKTLALPLHWTKPRRIFVNSLSDLFHDDVPDEFIASVFAVMRRAHQHTFQLLTKRHARMRSLLNSRDFIDTVHEHVESAIRPMRMNRFWPLPNVWLGVSVENQQWADIRIPALLNTPAAVRFLSCEPLLGAVDLTEGEYLRCGNDTFGHECRGCTIDWVIVGGESGHGARPMQADWVRSLRDQCGEAGVPLMFKQAGTVLAREWGSHGKGGDPEHWPEPFPREYPATVTA